MEPSEKAESVIGQGSKARLALFAVSSTSRKYVRGPQ